jgi:hypothetical protein
VLKNYPTATSVLKGTLAVGCGGYADLCDPRLKYEHQDVLKTRRGANLKNQCLRSCLLLRVERWRLHKRFKKALADHKRYDWDVLALAFEE